MNFGYFLTKIKDVKWRDILSVFPMMIGMCGIPFAKRKYSDTWLVGEADNEARDNGYHFFKYVRENHPEQKTVYFISPNATDASKVIKYGPIVKQGSIKHWTMYFTCPWIISSQKGGKPNAALCAFIELKGWFKPHFVFLQHGVTKDKNSWLMADKCVFDYVITATRSEYEFMKSAFGYREGIVQLTGFPRFDNLHDVKVNKKRIVIMPTWRTWLCNNSSKGVTGESDFKHSQFVQKWLELLNSDELAGIAKDNNLEILFYPHRQLQSRLDQFCITNPYIRVIRSSELDIQEALRTSALMITDWSSVYFDMFYMKKPVILYQFDEEEFRAHHYEDGWFDYHNNPFSLSINSCKDVIDKLREYIDNDFSVSQKFIEGHHYEFELYDSDNSERVYQLIHNHVDSKRLA